MGPSHESVVARFRSTAPWLASQVGRQCLVVRAVDLAGKPGHGHYCILVTLNSEGAISRAPPSLVLGTSGQ